MNGLEAILDMLVNVVLNVIVAFANILDSFSNTEAGKQIGLDTANYAGAPSTPAPPLTVEALQSFGVDTALKFLIPLFLICYFLPKMKVSRKAK